MKFKKKKKLRKKGGQKKQIHCDEVKKKRIRGVSFVDWRSFKTNKRVILFCRHFNIKQEFIIFVNLLF